MAGYELEILPSVGKDVRGIPSGDLGKILKRIETLRDDPRPPGCMKLSDREHYRIRQGDYRIVYEIQDPRRAVVIVRIGNRREVFRSKR